MQYLFCFHFPFLSDTNKNTDSKLHNFYKVSVFLHPEDVKIDFFQAHSTGESFVYVPVEPKPVINTDENVYFVSGYGLVFKSIQLHTS